MGQGRFYSFFSFAYLALASAACAICVPLTRRLGYAYREISSAVFYDDVSAYMLRAKMRAEHWSIDAGTYVQIWRSKFDAFRKTYLEKASLDQRAVALAI